MRSFTAPPRSIEFSKFVEFTLLLANPQDLSEQIAQFQRATDEYKAATSEYADALKISSSVSKAAILEKENELECNRLNALSKVLDARDKEFKTTTTEERKKLDASISKAEKEISAKWLALNNEIREHNEAVEKQEADIVRREQALVDGQTSLEAHLTSFNAKKERIDAAFGT